MKQQCSTCNNAESLREAKALLMYAFSNAVIENIKIPELKQRITKIIAKLGVKMGFDL
jgi:Fe-S cluster assembly protein SufD